ncbi:hypothetical protein GCM10020216_094950 [Nonomuraea helvata]
MTGFAGDLLYGHAHEAESGGRSERTDRPVGGNLFGWIGRDGRRRRLAVIRSALGLWSRPNLPLHPAWATALGLATVTDATHGHFPASAPNRSPLARLSRMTLPGWVAEPEPWSMEASDRYMDGV